MGFALPHSARSYPAWWSNGSGMPHSLCWLDVGWRTQELDLGSGKVTFRRLADARIATSRELSARRQSYDIVDPYEWDRTDYIDVRIEMTWMPLGRVALDGHGGLRFPNVPAVPGLYRFQIRGTAAAYVGETENMARRFGHYRKPGPSQLTNLRLNAKFREMLAGGAEVAVAIVISGAWIIRGEDRQPADLSLKPVRRMFENAALLRGGADIETLNRI